MERPVCTVQDREDIVSSYAGAEEQEVESLIAQIDGYAVGIVGNALSYIGAVFIVDSSVAVEIVVDRFSGFMVYAVILISSEIPYRISYLECIPECGELTEYDKETLNEFKDVTCINRKMKIAAVVDSRNYYSHLTERVKKNKLDGVKIFDLTHDLRKILLCCVLSYLGFSNPEIERCTKDCNNSFVRGYR